MFCPRGGVELAVVTQGARVGFLIGRLWLDHVRALLKQGPHNRILTTQCVIHGPAIWTNTEKSVSGRQ